MTIELDDVADAVALSLARRGAMLMRPTSAPPVRGEPRDVFEPPMPLPVDSSTWTGSLHYGNAVDVPQGTLIDTEIALIKAEFPVFPSVMTVSLGMSFNPSQALWPSTGTHGRMFGLLASILFGSGGATQSMLVDFTVGQPLALPANTLKIGVRLDPSLGDQSLPAQLQASALVAQGSPCRDLTLTRTWYVGNVGGGPLTVQIPAFARAVSIAADTVGAGSLEIVPAPAEASIFTETLANMLANYSRGQFTRLPNWARWIRLTGTSSNLSLVFLMG